MSVAAPYQLLPRLKAEELSALRADIELRGVQVAVELDDDGNILDGHHRVAIADELGIEYPTIERHFDNEQEKREHVIKLNLARRHLAPHEWGKVFAQLLDVRGIERGQGARNDNGTSATVAEVADELGVPERTARHRLRRADEYDALPEARQDLIAQGTLNLHDAVIEDRRDQRATEKKRLAAKERQDFKLSDDCGVITGDFRKIAKTIADNSVDLIFTDPPYCLKDIPIYGDLAEVAARVLKPGGSLIAEVGNYAIPDILDLMRPHLQYLWTLGVIHTGQLAQMRYYAIKVARKPLLWFVKGARRKPMDFVLDAIEGKCEKEHHAWQKGGVEAAYYIEKLTQPGDLVFDPCCGSGTVAVACKRLGRKWITCEVDPDTATLARKRIREAEVA